MLLRHSFCFLSLLCFSALTVWGVKVEKQIVLLNSATFGEHWSNAFFLSLHKAAVKENFRVDTFELGIPLLKTEQEVKELCDRVLARFPEKPQAVVLIGDPGWVACASIFR